MAQYTRNSDDDEDAGTHRQRTGSFNSSALVDPEKGLVFGMEVGRETAGSANLLLDQAKARAVTWLRLNAAEPSGQIIRRIWPKMSAEKAMATGNRVADVIGYASLFLPEIYSAYRTASKTIGSYYDLMRALRPIAKGNGYSSLGALFSSCNNEVICNARKKISSVAMSESAMLLAGGVANAPNLAIAIYEGKAINEERRKLLEQVGNTPLTAEARARLLQEMEENAHQIAQDKLGAETDLHREMKRTAAGIGSTLLRNLLTGFMGGKKELERFSGDIALDKILHLRRMLEEANDRETLPGHGRDEHRDYSIVQYVHEIFQQHQRDCGKPAIQNTMTSHLDQARWNLEALREMPDGELNVYEYAVKTIAQKISSGEMDALALVNLAGQRKIVKPSGKAFGRQGVSGNDEKVKQDLLEEINKQCVNHKGSHEASQEEVQRLMDSMTMSPDEIRSALKNLKGLERAFFFSTIDRSAPNDEVLKKLTGLDPKQIMSLRKEMSGRFEKMIEAGVLKIAEVARTEPQKLLDAGMNEEHIDQLLQVAQAVQAGQPVADQVAGKPGMAGVETDIMKLGNAMGPGYWTELVGEAKKRTQQVKQGEKHAEPNAEESRAEVLDRIKQKAERFGVEPSGSHRAHAMRRDMDPELRNAP